MAEPVRLVIWDLDEVFWKGTLTEGGIQYLQEHHDIVVALARRGIMSSICSRNNLADVKRILEEKGLWDSFIFPSVNWEAKGPRLARLVEAVQLRAPTILFIDDNPGNRNEALHFVPDLQVADETIVPALLDNPLFKGKDDSALTRLAQYKVLETRALDQDRTGDNLDFLRQSGIEVSIEYNIEKHIDRAIELINRTNQLNFTQLRLSEDAETARSELRKFLANENAQAGLVHVRDKYGDYGFTGFYAMHVHTWWLHHFCFSCRTIGMGVEAWLYERLGRPKIVRAAGGFAQGPESPHAKIDWINQDAEGGDAGERKILFGRKVLVRGGCDAQAIMHYLGPVSNEVIGEFPFDRAGRMIAINHSVFLEAALDGLSEAAFGAAESLGHQRGDFSSLIADAPESLDACVFSFWADGNYALYRHKEQSLKLPFPLPRFNCGDDVRKISDEQIAKYFPTEQERRAFDVLVGDFEFEPMSMASFEKRARRIFTALPPAAPIFVLLGLERERHANGKETIVHHMVSLNNSTRKAAEGLPNVHFLPVGQFIESESDVIDRTHLDRLVYYRIYQKIASMLRPIMPDDADEAPRVAAQ